MADRDQGLEWWDLRGRPDLAPRAVGELSTADVPAEPGIYFAWYRTGPFQRLLEDAGLLGLDPVPAIEREGFVLAYVGMSERGTIRDRFAAIVPDGRPGSSPSRMNLGCVMFGRHGIRAVDTAGFGRDGDRFVIDWIKRNGAFSWQRSLDPASDEKRAIRSASPPLNIALRTGPARDRLAAIKSAHVRHTKSPHLREVGADLESFFRPAPEPAAPMATPR